MKKLTATVLGLALAASAAAEEVNRTLDASPDGEVHISNISGTVSVTGWARDQVEVKGKIGPNVEELIFERSGDKITIKVKVPRKSGRGVESHLYVQVPAASSIDVGTVSADIEVAGVRGEQQLEAVSGDIETECDDADVSAGTVSGDVIMRGNGRDAETHSTSVSGDVRLDKLAGDVFAESVSGDLVIEDGSFDRASFNVVNGDIVFRSALRSGGKLKAETVNGEVELRFRGDVFGQFDIDTFNGDIENCFGPKPRRTSKYAPGMELSFTEGDGDARITVSTVNGDITICK